jgi:hypothetical protein
MSTLPWWSWIVLTGLLLLCGLLGQWIAKSQSGLDDKEWAVVRQAAGVGGGEAVGRALGYGVFDPNKSNRADGVIFSFHGLQLTRTELIRGYGEHAQRIPLHGLSASLVGGKTVQIRIDGPDTMFFYRNTFDAEFNQSRALQFAALLNYEASQLAVQSSGL